MLVAPVNRQHRNEIIFGGEATLDSLIDLRIADKVGDLEEP